MVHKVTYPGLKKQTLIYLMGIIWILIVSPCLGNAAKPPLSPGEKSWIEKGITVRVRIGNAPPFMVITDKIQGIAIDYLTYIFKLNNIKFQYVRESEVTWPQALKYIEQHDVVDMVPTAKITEERQKKMLFTDEYIFSPWVIFTRTDADFVSSIEDLKGKTMSVEEGFVIHERLKRDYPEIKLKVVSSKIKNYAEIPIRDLSTGIVDAYIGNLFMTTYMIQSKGYTNVKVAAPTPFGNHNQAMALRSDWPELVSIINKTLEAMTPEEHAAIKKKWLVVRYEYGIHKHDVLKWILGVTGAASVFIMFILFWNKLLKKEITFREKAEADLREREILLNDVGKIAKIGGWEMDLLTRKSKWTKGTYDIAEIGMDTPVPGPDEYINYYLPEYRAMVSDAMAALIDKDTPLAFEAPLKTAGGNIKWCRTNGRAIRKDGECIKVYGTFQDITEQKQAEKSAQQSEIQLQTLVAAIPDLVWLKDPDGTYLSCNQTFERFFGAKESDIVGRTDYDFVDKGLADFFRENDRWAMKADVPRINEEWLTFADEGYKGLFETVKTPVRDTDGKLIGVLGISRDITDRKKTETALKASEQRYKSAQRMGQVGNWEYDLVTENFWGSDEAKRIYGFEPGSENFTTKEVENCIPERERVHQALIDLIEKNDPYDLEFEIHPVNGAKRRIIRSIAELQRNDSGIPFRVTGVIQDITLRKEEEFEKQRLELKLLQAQKIKAIGMLAGGIAHDFNNILYPIIGFAELSIQDLPENHPVQENLEDILNGAKRARDLVKQILSFSSQRDVEYKPLAVQPIIEETLRLLRSIIPANVDIQKEISGDDIYIFGNTTEVHEVIMNICTNAYHAMEENGGVLLVSVKLSRPEPELKLGNDEYCCLSIRDTGQGIPAEILDRIYDPYFTTKDQGKGSGLGLSVVHGIVKSYHGAIDVKSQLGKGTTVTLYFPAITKPETEKKGPLVQPDSIGSEHILLVDDEPAIVKLGTRMLERLGYTVTAKTSSLEALELFESNPDGFDLVITDMTMPILLGTELAQKMLTIRNDLPILLCTGFSEKVDKETASTFGIKGYINKPILLKELTARIREILDTAG